MQNYSEVIGKFANSGWFDVGLQFEKTTGSLD
jgi:hypothetical protein